MSVPSCACGHTAHWHSHDGAGSCEHGGECRCERFSALPDLLERVGTVLAWVDEQHDYCRPPGMEHLSAEELGELRGPCAAYGAVVYGLVAHKLRAALDEEQR